MNNRKHSKTDRYDFMNSNVYINVSKEVHGGVHAGPLFNRAFIRAINMKYVSVTAGDCYDIAMEAAASVTWPGCCRHPARRAGPPIIQN